MLPILKHDPFINFGPLKRTKIRSISTTFTERSERAREATWLFSTLHFSWILKLRVPVTSVAKSVDCVSLISAEGRDAGWRIVWWWWWRGVPGSGAHCACASFQRHTTLNARDGSTTKTWRFTVTQSHGGETTWHTITTAQVSLTTSSFWLVKNYFFPQTVWWGDAASESQNVFACHITKIT